MMTDNFNVWAYKFKNTNNFFKKKKIKIKLNIS